ncbi:MAG TPA: adenylate/guanylate cyclase domain-containing protein [Stellaceae bacterium]|jgi:adenylate cyclase|nr:adenylate/guanylate cyclase domain-containing protein [Stellaceae bacterium]
MTQLAERLIEHRLSQPDMVRVLAGQALQQPTAPIPLLLDIFRAAARVHALHPRPDRRVATDGAIGIVVAGLNSAIGTGWCRLIFADPPHGDFFVLRGNGSIDEKKLPGLSGLAAAVFADGKGRRGLLESCAQEKRQAFCVALRRHGRVVGVLELGDKATGDLNAADIALAEVAAPCLAALVAGGGLLPQIEDERRASFRIIEQQESIDDLSGRDLILSKILAVAIDVLDADRGAIFLYDPATRELYARRIDGIGNSEIRIDAGLGLIGSAFQGGETVNVADAYHDPRFHPGLDWNTGYRTRSVLCAPVFGNDGKRVGAVQLLNKRRGNFTAADERRLRGLASQMGVTIDYATLFEQTLSLKSYNESMLRSLSNGVVTVDLNHVVTFINQAASRILRLDDDAAVGRRLGDIFDGLNGWVAPAVEEVSDDGIERLLPNSEFYIEQDDTWVAANLTLIPLRDAKQTPLGTMIVIEDVQREKELRRTMSRYLSNEVIDRLMIDTGGGLGGSSHAVTILFSDIRGFTTLTERLGAGDTVSMLNEYFSFMEDVVTNHSGMIDKYIGDAIMALFGSPFPSDNDAGNAVRAAIDMFQALRLLNARRVAENKAAIRIGVGIGTGVVVTGNIGSPKRMDFTVIGDPVNLASRIESATKTYGADILVCGTTWAQLKSPPRARRLDVVRLRGQTRPTDLWEIVEHRPELAGRAVEAYEQGLGAYLAGEWADALRLFETAGTIRLGDKAAQLMVTRCRRFLAHRPDAWDGVADLD